MNKYKIIAIFNGKNKYIPFIWFIIYSYKRQSINFCIIVPNSFYCITKKCLTALGRYRPRMMTHQSAQSIYKNVTEMQKMLFQVRWVMEFFNSRIEILNLIPRNHPMKYYSFFSDGLIDVSRNRLETLKIRSDHIFIQCILVHIWNTYARKIETKPFVNRQ